jgi:hypothetical protein
MRCRLRGERSGSLAWAEAGEVPCVKLATIAAPRGAADLIEIDGSFHSVEVNSFIHHERSRCHEYTCRR